LDTSNLIAEAGLTNAPASGSVLIIPPAGTESLCCVFTAPTPRPAFFNITSAARRVKPTTSGTATFAGPLDTSRFTADPELTSVPAAGVVLITLPVGVVALPTVVTVPTTRPALFIFASASDCVKPTTSGTIIWYFLPAL
jgi:hypothetical protein